MHRNRSVSSHQFAMVPRADIPRASFNMQRAYKTTFDSGYLVPVFCEEILPGDSFKVKMTAFARLATPIVPIMDNLYLESFFFFVPKRLVWDNWARFMGEREQPEDSTSFVIPTTTSPVGGYLVNSLQDYFGLPTVGQLNGGATIEHNSLPLRAYNLIYNEWFRDENLAVARGVPKDDGPDDPATFYMMRRGKRFDYFSGCLPWPQKGDSVGLPLAGILDVHPSTPATSPTFIRPGGSASGLNAFAGQNVVDWDSTSSQSGRVVWDQPNLVVDMGENIAVTINQMRQAFQIQRLLERDARGGTRLTEIIRAHFGVVSPDARLQRPEYLGGGSTPVTINPVAQTSATGDVAGSTTPLGHLSAVGTALAGGHGFTQSFTEHGYVIGLVNVRADLTYQQGLRKMWSRSTRYDFYFPAFAMLGEQAVLSREIFCDGTAGDEDVFGYQERWAEYRYSPSQITGLFRSSVAQPLDMWHLSQYFITRPVLGQEFIEETPPVKRIVAVGSAAAGAEFIFDSFFDMKVARPMPLYSVPGMIDHF